MLLHESNGYFACGSARTRVGLGRGGAGLGPPTGRMRDRGGGTGVGARGRDSGGEADEREREPRTSQVTDGTCAREGVLFTRTSDRADAPTCRADE